MATNRRPEVFGDNYRRCLVSSIASYEQLEDGKINIYLKSGDTTVLNFDVDYLADLAMKKLDSYFKIDVPAATACNVCTNKDKLDDSYEEKITFCAGCAGRKSEFKAPGETKDE